MKSLLRVRLALLGWAAAGLACAAGAARHPPPAPDSVDLRPVWSALWQGDYVSAAALADDLGWAAQRSVAGERMRQHLGVLLGRRGERMAEVQRWRAAEPNDPDLAYLEARLLQHRERQERRFEELVDRWPRHAWIRLGISAVALDAGGSLSEAQHHWSQAPDWPAARSFRNQVEARILARRGRAAEALRRLEPAALEQHDFVALQSYAEIAASHGLEEELRLARAEAALLRLSPASSAAARIDAAVEHVLARAGRAGAEPSLAAYLRWLDEASARAGLPGGWARHPRYVAGPWGTLLRPEADSGPLMATWAEAQRGLLLGSAALHGAELLLLKEVRRHSLVWPGQEQPLEVWLAGSAESSHGNPASGATLFRGFFLRMDLVQSVAAQVQRSSELLRGQPEIQLWPEEALAGDPIPEDYDLPLRLRAKLLAAGHQAAALELAMLALHEAGHLPEVLSWLDDGLPLWLDAVPRGLISLLTSGDPLTWMEYRAQARALAAAPQPHWLLAEVVERAREGGDRYSSAYARLLRGLLEVARDWQLPPLHRWHELSAEDLQALAQELCRRQGLELLPAEGVSRLMALLRHVSLESPPPPLLQDFAPADSTPAEGAGGQ